MDYNVVSTGSQGNCLILGGVIAIDMGVAFKHIKDYKKTLQLVLLTHSHHDHMNKKTIYTLSNQRPNIRFAVPKWLADIPAKNIDICEMDTAYSYGEISIEPFELTHNVPNCGWKIYTGNKSFIYATDTNEINTSAPNFDYYFIEANFSEDEIMERIKRKQENGEFIYEYDVLGNHLSKEKADKWLLENMGELSKAEYMHVHVERG